jgi:excisionase family DNA binding protein
METMSTHWNISPPLLHTETHNLTSHVDTATLGMDTQPTSPRTELDLMTEQELASHLKICRRQLYNWRVAGRIPYFKMGKAVRFRVADVAAAIERMRVG